jgi:CubicO group peptidase (beta-lactamase class C family)
VTTVAALTLVESGRLNPDDSIVVWLPELGRRQVLVSARSHLDDTVPARRDITLRHLLTNTAGYGMIFAESPLRAATAINRTEARAATCPAPTSG